MLQNAIRTHLRSWARLIGEEIYQWRGWACPSRLNGLKQGLALVTRQDALLERDKSGFAKPRQARNDQPRPPLYALSRVVRQYVLLWTYQVRSVFTIITLTALRTLLWWHCNDRRSGPTVVGVPVKTLRTFASIHEDTETPSLSGWR